MTVFNTYWVYLLSQLVQSLATVFDTISAHWDQLWTYPVFFALSVFFFATRKRPRFLLTQWLVGFVSGLVVMGVSVWLWNVPLAISSVVVPLFFLLSLMLAGQGFDKFVINTLMMCVAIIPLPYNLYGLFLTLLVVVGYALLRSPDTKTTISMLYTFGPNIVGMLTSLRDDARSISDNDFEGTRVNPVAVWAMMVLPTIAVGVLHVAYL